MRVLALVVAVAACGGAEIPTHNGYKSEKAQPWKKTKQLKFDANGEAKADGSLSYPERRRAAWFDVDLASAGDLGVRAEAPGPGDAVNDNFDLGVEVLDPHNNSLKTKDLDNGDQQNADVKTIDLTGLPAGHYFVHLYLQGRMDTTDYTLRVTFKPGTATAGHSDFPAQVASLPSLPMVPVNDDTPKTYRPPVQETHVTVTHATHHHDTPKKDDKPPPVAVTARIIGISAVSGGTQITVARGTANGASAGMAGHVTGLANGGFTLAACNDHTCTAVVKATPDQMKSSFQVELGN